jgi:acetyl-CoA C-acetyltransferase
MIVSVARTPITQSFKGALASVPATRLGSVAIKGALERAKVSPGAIEEVYFGQVLQAAAGQAPARQAALGAGLHKSVICTTVNKVCASGMKAIMLAAQAIKCGDKNIVIAGGMESMSQVPWHLSRTHRGYGKLDLVDGIEHDGLTDAYDKIHMGLCAENTCKKHGITRKDQDEFAISSYMRSAQAHESGSLAKEIVPVELVTKKATSTIKEDEEFRKVDFARMTQLTPAFDRTNGTVTAANASSLNDGAAATLLMSARMVDEHKLSPLAEIVAYADAACDPIDFPLAPALSIPRVSTNHKL